MVNWFVKGRNLPREKLNKEDLDNLGINERVLMLLYGRGLYDYNSISNFLYPSSSQFHNPSELKDLTKAAQILGEAREKSSKIIIIGDYDVDGIMSTTILMKGLRALGFNVDYIIPDREKDGYGINNKLIDRAHLEKNAEIILTCDNGIAATGPVAYAKKKGLKVIVTDHHEVPKGKMGEDIIPKADSVINPMQKACDYPNKNLSGGAVAYKLIDYLFTALGIKDKDLKDELLAYAAISIVCDVMKLVGENRAIVKIGLEKLNNLDLPSVSALKKISKINGDINAEDLGFQIGPRLNSAGRLSSASDAVEMFLTDDREKIESIAEMLDKLNEKRKEITSEGVALVEPEAKMRLDAKDRVLILENNKLHHSICGIVAGRIANKFKRPTIIFSQSDSGYLKGSGRTYGPYNMYDEIKGLRYLLNTFGGHKAACGMSLSPDNFYDFREAVNKNCSLSLEDFIEDVRLDDSLAFEKVDLSYIEMLKKLEPFGNGNPKPVFGAKGLVLKEAQIIGKNKNVVKLKVEDELQTYTAINFFEAKDFEESFIESFGEEEYAKVINGEGDREIDIAYFPLVNEFMGNTEIQFLMENYKIK